MNETQAREIVDATLEPMMRALRVGTWKLHVIFDVGYEAMASIVVSTNSREATLRINPDLHGSEEDLLDSLRHELLHLYHASLWQLRRQIDAAVGDDTMEILSPMVDHVAEEIVRNIEDLLDHEVRGSPRVLVRRGKELTR